MSDADTRAALTALPKVELHCHLEGSMSSTPLRALSPRHAADHDHVRDGPIPDHLSFADFPDFCRQCLFGLSMLRDGEDRATAA